MSLSFPLTLTSPVAGTWSDASFTTFLSFSSSFFKTVDLVLFNLFAGLAMAAALAAATLSAAAVGFTGAVLFTARLLVAEAVLLFVTLGLGPAVAEEAVLAGVTLGPVPVFLGESSGLVLVVTVEGLDRAGLDLLLEA